MLFSLFKCSGLCGIGDEKIWNENWFENGIFCVECYKMNKYFFDVYEILIIDGWYVFNEVVCWVESRIGE